MDRLAQLEKLLAADPADADLPYMIALEHAKRGSPEQALDWLDRTLALNPDYFYAYYQKGLALAQRGDPAEAKRTLQLGLDRAKAANDHKATSELSDLLRTLP